MVHVVSEFYNKIQFPGHYTQKEIIQKRQDFFLDKFLDISLLPGRGKILEAGCGSGYTTHVIATLRTPVSPPPVINSIMVDSIDHPTTPATLWPVSATR